MLMVCLCHYFFFFFSIFFRFCACFISHVVKIDGKVSNLGIFSFFPLFLFLLLYGLIGSRRPNSLSVLWCPLSLKLALHYPCFLQVVPSEILKISISRGSLHFSQRRDDEGEGRSSVGYLCECAINLSKNGTGKQERKGMHLKNCWSTLERM